jgi:lipid II:glycine glycyltransferase (peptidoglycan interpeptide bridge formation enzyme)
MSKVNSENWQAFLQQQENVHILQTAGWGLLKSKFGWEAHAFIRDNSGAQVLLRKLPLGYHIGYIPFGPIGIPSEELLLEIREFCKSKKCVFLKIEPDIWQESFPGSEYEAIFAKLQKSKSIQPPNTILISLDGEAEEWLNRMKQKTRYNVRLAAKKGVVIEESNSIDTFHELMLETGERDAFGVHSKNYYQTAFDLFKTTDSCKLFIASYEGKPLAGIMVFISGDRAWYFYGASNNVERNRMPTYLIQWEAMQYCANRGCRTYDLWGIPDESEDFLEEKFMDRSDGLWSVYRFKRGFGGKIKRLIGAWDDVYHPLLYKLYQWWSERNVHD